MPMRRALLAALTSLVLLAALAAPASAATVKRTWWTNLGTGGANGRITLQGYMDGTGSMAVVLKALRANSSYSIRVRAGSCSRVGDLLYDGGYLRTDGSGNASASRKLTLSPMNRIWGKIRFYTVSVRVTSGTSQRCGAFVFNKATRVAINYYSINLPVIASSGYPKCGVAMYLRELSQPREPGVTYIYAHARKGMFLPLLNASKINNGAAMIGKLVRVYTTDNKMVTYQIDRVRRHVSSIQNSLGITAERLWLQTSEGPNFSYPKLVIEAKRISIDSVSYATAHPTPHPYTC
jgi:hypothetical protein